MKCSKSHRLKKYLFYLGHPAQYLFIRKSIMALSQAGHCVKIIIKSKDVLEDLLIRDSIDYINILPQKRRDSKYAIVTSLLKRIIYLARIIQKIKPDLLISTDASTAILGLIFSVNRITITEDDYKVIKLLGDLTYPFTQTILCPEICDVGNWEHKKAGYPGYMKLAYLHPNIFHQNKGIRAKYGLPQKFILLRLAKLTAFHDHGMKGISNVVLEDIINKCEINRYHVLISAEDTIEERYSKYLLKIKVHDMHHVLAAASLLISDSQSMSVEAAILGVPSIRISSFVGKISVLEELEHTYKLTFGVLPDDSKKLFLILDNILKKTDLKLEYEKLQKKMLAEKIDVSAFLTWFIENYPTSQNKIQNHPEIVHKRFLTS
jgi:uncharacterized protein